MTRTAIALWIGRVSFHYARRVAAGFVYRALDR